MTGLSHLLLEFEYIFLWVMLYSFLGWVYESIVVSVQERRPINRGFLMGPICPIYGVGAVGGALALSQLHNPVALFLVGALLASVLEYLTSWVMEKLFDARWWDYSQFRFNINGRVCLLGAVIFGVFAVVVVRWTQPLVVTFTDRVPVPAVHALAGVVSLLLAVDLAVTLAGMKGFMERVERFGQLAAEYGVAARRTARRTVDEYASKAGESISAGRQAVGAAVSDATRTLAAGPQVPLSRLRDRATELFTAQQRRMLNAFPEFTSFDHRELIDQLREILNPNRTGRGKGK